MENKKYFSAKELAEYNIKKLYRAKELAEYLGVGLSTVWLYAKQGKITPKKLSSRVTVFDISEVEKNLLEVQNG